MDLSILGRTARTLEELDAQEEAIDAWAAELDASAWKAYWDAEDRLEADQSAESDLRINAG